MAENRSKNRAFAVTLFAVAGAMVGLTFASVPLYRLFCQVTGFGGIPRVGAAAGTMTVSEQTITVFFDANVNESLPWRFRPVQRRMRVRAGETVLVFYRASNLSQGPVTGTATFNVTPYKAAPYFSKVDCFCFTEQRLEAGQVVELPVSFFVDPAIFSDPDTREVRSITLSYTFFRVPEAGGGERASARTPGSG